MANVTFMNITKRFGSLVAVDDLNLEVADREFLVLFDSATEQRVRA